MKKVHEPTTVITDGFIALLGCYIGIQLLSNPLWTIQSFWGMSFISIAISAVSGSIRHGWGPHYSQKISDDLNRITYVGIGMTTATLLLGVVTWQGSNPMVCSSLIILSFLYYIRVAFKMMTFRVVMMYYFPALLLILVLTTLAWNNDVPGAGTIAVGILVSLLAGVVQLSGWPTHRYFNHNDLYHIIQLGGMWFMYTGVLQIR